MTKRRYKSCPLCVIVSLVECSPIELWKIYIVAIHKTVFNANTIVTIVQRSITFEFKKANAFTVQLHVLDEHEHV